MHLPEQTAMAFMGNCIDYRSFDETVNRMSNALCWPWRLHLETRLASCCQTIQGKWRWLFSGDMALMDEDGYTFIVDRKKDMILAGGYNIYPREINEVLFENPKILEACAKSIADAYHDEIVQAFVVPIPGSELTEAEIIDWCWEKLATYKAPSSFVLLK